MILDKQQEQELMQIWYASKTACSGDSRYARMQWTVRWYCKRHPEHKGLAIYKALERATYWLKPVAAGFRMEDLR
jgi:frataxin-like iron-binding protein CyaY